jgi:hypothetical protein
MINLISDPTEDPVLPRLAVCLSSLTPLARNGGQVVRSIEDFKTAEDVSSAPGSSLENGEVSPRTNVHQRIKKDRIGYVRISLDLCFKRLPISILHSDSDSRL